MTTRTTRKKVIFLHSFTLKDVDRTLPPGEYAIVTDEELGRVLINAQGWPLSRAKQKWPENAATSPFDPKRSSG
jgi:hypothetical protein